MNQESFSLFKSLFKVLNSRSFDIQHYHHQVKNI